MLFHSPEFLLLFLPLALAGYYLLGRVAPRQRVLLWLFLASLFFYGWWNPKYLALILSSMAVNYAIGRRLSRAPGKVALAAGVGFNLALLGFFKYAMFFTANVNAVMGTRLDIGVIVLPLAISFFTFQQIAFLVDSYRGKATHTNPLNYGLFVTFFPQLIAGPIVHHREMMPQFAREGVTQPRLERFAVGLSMLTIGLAKKVFIADELDTFATPIFDLAAHGHLNFATAWVGALSYTFQIYFDFSGYTDMAAGIARMFGIRLPLNFYSPYKANSIIEFWRRWHITLSRFLRDYLYIPLGGSRRGPRRRYVNIMITMLLGGLWHGAAWTFMIWGGLHGLCLAVNHLWRGLGMRMPGAAARLLTFLAVVAAWVFFRADTFTGAVHFLHAMFSYDGHVYHDLWGSGNALRGLVGLHRANMALPLLAACLAICWWLPNSNEIMRRYRPFIGHRVVRKIPKRRRWVTWEPNLAWGFAFGLLLAACLWRVIYDPSKVFLYFQF